VKIAALLTARADSKSVPDKNLYRLNNIPLYKHNIIHALKSKHIQCIYVTTDSKEIINDCNNLIGNKLKVIVRPKSLCTDYSSHYDAIMHGFNIMEKELGPIDILVVLLGNTPHAYTVDLDRAIDEFFIGFDKYDSCMSVGLFNQFNPYRAFHQYPTGELKPVINPKVADFMTFRKNQNDKNAFGDVYFFNGSFWILKRQSLVDNNGENIFPWLGKRIMPYVQPSEYQEVDAKWQLKLLGV
jgi:N-acylneuraminate cytidylyltransferase